MTWVSLIALVFAGAALFILNKRLEEFTTYVFRQPYSFKEVDDRIYEIHPCPPNQQLIESLSNIVWAKKEGNKLIIKAETWESVEDICKTLNSGLES
jgi:hypothetical protein